MNAHQIAAIALGCAAIGVLLIAVALIVRIAAVGRSERTLNRALDERAVQSAAQAALARAAERAGQAGQPGQPGQSGQSGHAAEGKDAVARAAKVAGFKGLVERFAQTGARWIDTSLGRQIVAEEDRRLLDQCGFVDTRTRGLFLFARVAVGIVLPLMIGVVMSGRVSVSVFVMLEIMMIVIGFMVPKMLLGRWARRRRNGVVDELPLLVDLLRLLQGVGLSLDQSLQVMVNDFRTVLPVLSSELEIAQRQFAAGRSRDQSLSRLSSSFDNEDLNAVVRLLVQVDRHGGAVQEPLKQFGDRLRETRRAMLRERIGRMTVKMTGVMILTLLPALMIVTAGPGVLAVTKSLYGMHK